MTRAAGCAILAPGRPGGDAHGDVPKETTTEVFEVYAIISDGAHQYRVEEGQVFEVQRKDLDEQTTTIEFDRVLLVGGTDDGPTLLHS